jgi:hypothetical protein
MRCHLERLLERAPVFEVGRDALPRNVWLHFGVDARPLPAGVPSAGR